MAKIVRSGSFAGTGPAPDADVFSPDGDFNVTLTGTFTATVAAERSLDGGLTWAPYAYVDGTPIAWSAPCSLSLPEPEDTALWRLNCTSHVLGAVNWRLSQ